MRRRCLGGALASDAKAVRVARELLVERNTTQQHVLDMTAEAPQEDTSAR